MINNSGTALGVYLDYLNDNISLSAAIAELQVNHGMSYDRAYEYLGPKHDSE